MLDEAETTLTSIDQASERLVQSVLKQAQTAKPSYGQQQRHKAAAPSGMADHAAHEPIAEVQPWSQLHCPAQKWGAMLPDTLSGPTAAHAMQLA